MWSLGGRPKSSRCHATRPHKGPEVRHSIPNTAPTSADAPDSLSPVFGLFGQVGDAAAPTHQGRGQKDPRGRYMKVKNLLYEAHDGLAWGVSDKPSHIGKPKTQSREKIKKAACLPMAAPFLFRGHDGFKCPGPD